MTTPAIACKRPKVDLVPSGTNPGSVVAVHVDEGATVTAGAPLVSIEAMKMEHPVLAPHDGTVHLLVAVGDQARRGQPVATVTAAVESAATEPAATQPEGRS